MTKDSIHHIAIPCDNVTESLKWYSERFLFTIDYQDETWAMISFNNIKLAFVKRSTHPPHIGFEMPDWIFSSETKRHRDGTESIYFDDPSGNTIEILKIMGPS